MAHACGHLLATGPGLDILHRQCQPALAGPSPCLDDLHSSPVRLQNGLAPALNISVQKRGEVRSIAADTPCRLLIPVLRAHRGTVWDNRCEERPDVDLV